ncbi:MAG: hypothetical protein P8M20_09355 [Planctomycetaceae bacterium]|nr:hypothetical protein [Planctomycetaceae bacterium]
MPHCAGHPETSRGQLAVRSCFDYQALVKNPVGGLPGEWRLGGLVVASVAGAAF